MGNLKHIGHTSKFYLELPWRRLGDLKAGIMQSKTSRRAHKLQFDLKMSPVIQRGQR